MPARILIVCATAGLVAGAASLVLRLPLAVGAGVLAGIVARHVYEARRKREPVDWIHAVVECLLATAAASVVLWLLIP